MLICWLDITVADSSLSNSCPCLASLRQCIFIVFERKDLRRAGSLSCRWYPCQPSWSEALTIACFCDFGSRPCENDMLMSAVMNGRRSSSTSLRRKVGAGSRDNILEGYTLISDHTLASYTGLKAVIEVAANDSSEFQAAKLNKKFVSPLTQAINVNVILVSLKL